MEGTVACLSDLFYGEGVLYKYITEIANLIKNITEIGDSFLLDPAHLSGIFLPFGEHMSDVQVSISLCSVQAKITLSSPTGVHSACISGSSGFMYPLCVDLTYAVIV